MENVIEEVTQAKVLEEKRPKNLMYVWIGSFFVVLLGLGIIYTFVMVRQPFREQVKTQAIISSPPSQPSLIPQINYVTEETKIATSLDVPPLYPGVNWKDITAESKDENINVVGYYDEGIYVPLKGIFWYTELPGNYSQDIIMYYLNDLDKKGWSVDASKLEFSTFNLGGLFADGVCGGSTAFIAYKDEMVKVVSIRYQLTPCYPPGEIPTKIKYSTGYTIFISDPTSLEEIADYIKIHQEKR